MKQLNGIGVSPGIAIGKAYLLSNNVGPIEKKEIGKEKVEFEVKRLKRSFSQTEKEIKEIKEKVKREVSPEEAEIFNLHILILHDKKFIEDIIKKIKEERINAESALSEVSRHYTRTFSRIEDDYLREKEVDIRDVCRRIIRNLLGIKKGKDLKEKVILIAPDLSPCETASLQKKFVLGFATEMGSKTSHTAIMGRALQIPVVLGVKNLCSQVKTGDAIILDGTNGKVIVEPDKDSLKKSKSEKRSFLISQRELTSLKKIRTSTTDGKRIKLLANIELPREVEIAFSFGAEGIGLFRTEFFYINRTNLPSEEEQFRTYRTVAKKMYPEEIVVRTLDLGGDKFASALNMPAELNPNLGCRAIRFCLSRPDIFRVQLRAILRASDMGNLKIMYPLISGIEELKSANQILEEVKKELLSEKKKFNEDIEVGIMIEVPSAALTADILAQESDFFSIGTNDLIQYAIAVDRTNENTAYLYEPTHPGIIRLLKNIIDAGHKKGIKVSVCGEVASDPYFALLLLGLGVDDLSMAPLAIPYVKKTLISSSYQKAKKIARKSLTFDTGKEVEAYLTGSGLNI